MNNKIQIMLTAFLIVFAVFNTAYCKTPSDLVKNIQSDMEYIFFVSPEESYKMFQKYSDNYTKEFKEILNDSERYDQSIIADIILINAILNNKNLFEDIKNVYTKNPKYYEQVTRFYYYRIGFERDNNLKLLISEFDKLIQKPTVSYLIVFMPFLNDIDLALRSLGQLNLKSDGVVSEIIHWSLSYLLYLNRDDQRVVNKIKKTEVYQMLFN